MASYDKFNRNELIAEINRMETSIATCKAKAKAFKGTEDNDMKVKVIEWEAMIELHKTKLEKATAALAAPAAEQPSTEQNIKTAVPSFILGRMHNYIQERVPLFDPNEGAVHTFISKLKIAYDLFVTNDSMYGPLLEGEFIRSALTRINSITLERLSSEKKATFTKFEDLEKLLAEEFAHLSTAYQLLQSFFAIDMQENETISALATRLDRLMNHVAGSIEKKFVATKVKTENKGNKSDAESTVMTARDVFSMLAGQRLLDFIQYRHPNVHMQMAVTKLDNLFTITDVASEANRLICLNKGTRDSMNCFGGNNLYERAGNNKQEHAEDDSDRRQCKYGSRCRSLIKRGKCNFGHTDEEKKKAIALAEKESTEKTEDEGRTLCVTSLPAMSSAHFQK